MNKVFIGAVNPNQDMFKKAKSIVRGTNYMLALYLPYRIEFYMKGKSGKNGLNSFLILKDGQKWNVSKRKYSETKGGYYDKIKTGVTQLQAYEIVKNLIK